MAVEAFIPTGALLIRSAGRSGKPDVEFCQRGNNRGEIADLSSINTSRKSSNGALTAKTPYAPLPATRRGG